MSAYRLLVFLASGVQIVIGLYCAVQLCMREEPAVLWLLVCSMVVTAGLASLMSLRASSSVSLSRMSTIKLNVLILGVFLLAALASVIGARHGDIPVLSSRRFLYVLLVASAPFLINALGLGAIQHRVRRASAA